MSFEGVKWAWEMTGITPTQKLVLMGLGNYANENNECYPGQERLAKHVGVSSRTIRRHLDDLENLGLIQRERRHKKDGYRTSDKYVLLIEKTLPDNLSSKTLPDTGDTLTGHFTSFLPDTGDTLTGHQCPSNSKRTISKNNQLNNQLSAREVSNLFDDAYSYWPKKRERKKSFEKFQQLSKKHDPEWLAAEIRKFGEAYAITTETQYVPSLIYWLRGERWTDELPVSDSVPSRSEEAFSFIERLEKIDESRRGGEVVSGGRELRQSQVG